MLLKERPRESLEGFGVMLPAGQAGPATPREEPGECWALWGCRPWAVLGWAQGEGGPWPRPPLPQRRSGLAQLLSLESVGWRPQIPQEQEGEQEEAGTHGEADLGPCQPVYCGETA